MKKSVILYGSFEKLSNAHKLVAGNKQVKYFVRMDTFHGDQLEALNGAKPMDGETLLNTQDIP